MSIEHNRETEKELLVEYDEFLTVKELMEILRIGQNKAYELLRSGEIASFLIGSRNKRVIKQSVIDFINKNKSSRSN